MNDVLHRVITSDVIAAAGHDVAPHYLPDGRIIFSSTRQRQSGAILVDEGKPQFPGLDEDFQEPAFVLHVMNADGSNIHQVSFNQSHDLDPTVLSSGEVAFTRWDGAGRVSQMSLYRMNPDGTNLQLLYGANSHATGTNNAIVQFLQPRELADGRMLSVLRPFVAASQGGNLVAIDTAQYVDDTQPMAQNIGILTGPAQVAATANDVLTDGTISPTGTYSAAYPAARWHGPHARELEPVPRARKQSADALHGGATRGAGRAAGVADLRHLDLRPGGRHAAAGGAAGRVRDLHRRGRARVARPPRP